MIKPTRIWELLISPFLVCAVLSASIPLRQPNPVNSPAKCTLPTVYNLSGNEHMELPPNARRAQERYSL